MFPNNEDAITDEELDALLDETGELASQLEEDLANDDGTDLDETGEEYVTEIAPTTTYHLDLDTGEIVGKIDDVTALKQFIVKALLTARDRHLIYSSDFASEIEEILAEQEGDEYTAVELERVCPEAIENDDRILEIESVEVSFEDDRVYVDVDCNTVYGQITERVMINGDGNL